MDDAVRQCMDRLNYIALLRDGWLNGFGKRASEHAINIARQIVRSTPEHADKYVITPRVEGGVEISFNIGEVFMSAVVMDQGSIVFKYTHHNDHDTFATYNLKSFDEQKTKALIRLAVSSATKAMSPSHSHAMSM